MIIIHHLIKNIDKGDYTEKNIFYYYYLTFKTLLTKPTNIHWPQIEWLVHVA